jgi:type II secretory pathway pseudopilin PulG
MHFQSDARHGTTVDSAGRAMMRELRGFTLIEMIVAFILLVLLLFSLGVLIPLSQVRIKSTTHRDIALTLADNMIERMRSISFDNVKKSLYSGENVPFDPPANQGTPEQFPPLPYPSISILRSYPSSETLEIVIHKVDYFFSVRAEADNGNPDLTIVNVHVMWCEAGRDLKAGKSTNASINLSSKISRTQK